MSIEKVRLTERDRMPWPEEELPSYELLFRECQPEHVYFRHGRGACKPNADEQAGDRGDHFQGRNG